MENQNQASGSGQQTINIQVPSADNIASRRSLIPLLFAAVIIFFFFNFFTVSCGGQKVGSVTGINLVTGTELKDRDMFSGRETKGEKIPSSAWAIIAFGAAIIGLGAFLIKEKREALIGTGAGAIGFGSLLILQFAIKNAIEKKSEGAIQTDFEFAYWGALIAMGVAGFISYLRMQKTHNIVVSVSPPAQGSNSVIDSPVINKTIETTKESNFDLIGWISKYKKMFLGILSLALAIFAIYFFFIKPDPKKDAIKAASSFCKCNEKNNSQIIGLYEKFIEDLKQNKYKSKQDARMKLQALKDSNDIINYNCIIEAEATYKELRSKYLSDPKLLSDFENVFNSNKKDHCIASNENELNTAFTKVENQISLLKDSENQAETHFSDINEFFNAFKEAVKSKDKNRLASFVYFPFDEQGSKMSKEDFMKNFSLADEMIELVINATSLNHYEPNSFSIDGTGMGFSKHGDGYWKWDRIYYGE